MTLKPAHALHLVGLLLLSTVGCVQEEPEFTAPLSGGVRVVVVAPRAVTPLQVGAMALTASRTAGGVDLTQDPEGSRTWAGSLRPDARGEEVFLGASILDAPGSITAEMRLDEGMQVPVYGEALAVLVPMLAKPGPPGLSNHAPNILGVTGPTAVVKDGATVALLAHVSDPDADALTYAWTASSGVLDCAEASCKWTAALPQDADARNKGALIGLRVTDARGAESMLQFRIAVGSVRGPGWLGDTRYNRSPIPSEAGAARDVKLNEPFQVQAAVTDEDGPQDVLTYAWSATCEGTFNDIHAASPVFTPTAEPANCGCQLKAAVTDGFGGSTEQLVNLCVRAEAPPVVDTVSQSATGALAGELVTFSVTATDPRGEALTFAWTSNVGALGTAVGNGSTSTVDWTELSCLPKDVTPTVEVVTTNASGASTRRSFSVAWAGRRCGPGESPCPVTLSHGQVTLREDCVVQSAMFIPDGYTLDGAGHTLTASEEGAGDHYKGAVLRNRGTVASVRGVTVTARGLSDVCDGDADRLRGILLDGASGTLEDTVVEDLNQAGNLGGCQEGFAIDVRNLGPGATPVSVTVRNNQLVGYQKAGVVVLGRVEATVEDNVIDGLGPTEHIARLGIQLAHGVSGQVVRNQVRGNAYLVEQDSGSGILVFGGEYYGAGRELCHDLRIEDNVVTENDVGVSLLQAVDLDFTPPPESQNIQVVGNTLTKSGLTNGYQAAISDNGTANLFSRNRISGDGYDPDVYPDNAVSLDVATQGDERQVGFATPARTLDVGACSQVLAVQGWDLAGNLAPLSVPQVALSASAPGTTFHLLPDCSDAPVTVVSLKNPQREGLFYLRATTAGPLTVTATGDGTSKTQEQTVR
ncbi:right-handed parallel beta-helix repeat-containing protein [Corallococcus sp. EGB]|uniref:right-handed parallel beta-helix repeat-containing protein n=1 Tax=Corallococcus sp. EGB TaxID=1521117 RepID=UPI001CBD97EA|nr:right-handed parallel beta-helix repeat-containing protein [Corallococcus sp. EGB]